VATLAFGTDFGSAAARATACAFGTFFFRAGVLLAAGRGGNERLATGRSSVTNAADQSVRTPRIAVVRLAASMGSDADFAAKRRPRLAAEGRDAALPCREPF
jgi:hypothetical protein